MTHGPPQVAVLLPLTGPEVRRLLWRRVSGWLPTQEHVIWWSRGRRRHQVIAKRCHYQRRVAPSSLQL